MNRNMPCRNFETNEEEELFYREFEEYNEHELFYREYQEKKKDPKAFETFLRSLDHDYAAAHHLIIPELARASNSALPLQEDQYFDMDTDSCVYLAKHNRYTPPFVHTHSFFEIIYVLRGSCLHHIHGRTETMQEGDLCMISPSVAHSIFADDGGIVINILIRKSSMTDIFFNVLRDRTIISDFFVNSIYLKDYAACLTFHTSGDLEIRKQILEMYWEQSAQEALSGRMISNMLMIFFIRLVRRYSHTATAPFGQLRDAASAQILHDIVNDYRTVTLTGLAEKYRYSVPYCSKYIKNMTGQNFLQLLQKIRFQKAENYLADTNFSIQKISDLLGYENPENFIRAFKKEYGFPPSQYRAGLS